MKHCPHCGERVDPGDAYCFECGTELTVADNREDRPRGRELEGTGGHRGQDSDPQGRTRGRNGGQGRARGGNRTQESPRGQGQQRGESRDQGRPRGPDPGYGEVNEPHGGVESLRTLWVAAALGVVAVVENLSAVLFADELVQFVEDSGFVDDLSTDTVVIQGGLGVALSLVVVGLCYYYYRQGYVDRRFFWGLIAGGIAGLLFGNAISFLILIAVGAYGLLVVLKRDKPGGRPSQF
jgi:hypothetical protein